MSSCACVTTGLLKDCGRLRRAAHLADGSTHDPRRDVLDAGGLGNDETFLHIVTLSPDDRCRTSTLRVSVRCGVQPWHLRDLLVYTSGENFPSSSSPYSVDCIHEAGPVVLFLLLPLLLFSLAHGASGARAPWLGWRDARDDSPIQHRYTDI
eukprot:gene5159-3708_t